MTVGVARVKTAYMWSVKYKIVKKYLIVSRHSLSSYGDLAFAVAGPTAWNSLSDNLCDPTLSTDSFRRLLKTRLVSEY